MKFDSWEDLHDPDSGELDDDAAGVYSAELCRRFADSPEASELPRAPKETGWSETQLSLAASHLGVTASEMTPMDLAEVLFELFPRKVVVDADEAPEIVRELDAFWCFVQREFDYSEAQGCLDLLRDGATEMLSEELGNSAVYGPGKQFAFFAIEGGYDLTTEAGRTEAMLAYNETLGPVPPTLQARRQEPRNQFARQKKRRKVASVSRRKNRRRKK